MLVDEAILTRIGNCSTYVGWVMGGVELFLLVKPEVVG